MLSEKIRELRRKNKLSQKELANKLNVSNGAIAMWETGKREPNSNTLYKLANIFNVSIDYLFGNTEIMQLKKIRQAAVKTQAEVAKSVNITQFTYSNYENGKTQPDFKTLKNLADYFNVSIDFILGNELYNKPAGEFYQLTDKQKELIPYIKNLDDETCMRVLGYLDKISQDKNDFILKERLKGKNLK